MTENGKGSILITGASSGIGRAAALAFDRAGYRVFAGVRRETDGQALRQIASARLHPLMLDVHVTEHIVAAKALLDREGSLFALINNAGHNYVAPFEATDRGKARALMETNLFGLAALTQTMIPLLRANASRKRATHIVNVSSIGGLIGIPWEPWYHTSKFAVIGLSESLRHELRRQHIVVSVVCPGGIKTPFIAKSGAEADSATHALEDEHRALYGPGMRRLSSLTRAVARAGSDPDSVARVIKRVLTTNRPRFLNVVGGDAATMLSLKRWLPAHVFHALIRGVFTDGAGSRGK
ncbi:MAG: SDR family NAD(P)-dependent oxidoreductase [Hyphomonadaceae bacterium]|nr:SDR family NAD(P)-dependent oxidoreductase [Hyphomonadaceae bacterium]